MGNIKELASSMRTKDTDSKKACRNDKKRIGKNEKR